MAQPKKKPEDEAGFLSAAFSDMITPGKGLSSGQKAHLVRGAVWDPIRSFVKNMTGTAGYGVRQIYYRKNLGRMGEGCVIDPYVFIEPPDRVYMGPFVMIDSFARLEAGKGIRIGDRCHIAPGSVLNGGGGIWIGNNAAIAAGSKIYSASDT
jgi:hypothetical protein